MPADTTTLALLREARERLNESDISDSTRHECGVCGAHTAREPHFPACLLARIETHLATAPVASDGAGAGWAPYMSERNPFAPALHAQHALLPDGREVFVREAGDRDQWYWGVFACPDSDASTCYGYAPTEAEAKAAAEKAAGVRT